MSILLSSGLMYGCVSPHLVRYVARGLLKSEVAELDDICLFLGAAREEAKPVWEGLLADGWIIQRGDTWVPAANVRELANARIGKPLARTKADQLLSQITANAAAINKLPPEERRLQWITEVAVFGSYLDDTKSELGDLDIAWSGKDRPGAEDWFFSQMIYGKDPLSPTRGALRPKSPYLSLIGLDEVRLLGYPYRTLYRFQPAET